MNKARNRKVALYIGNLLITAAIFFATIYPYSDVDWGWHIKYGEYFLKTGRILTQNIFTFTLAHYVWPYASWIYDVLLYVLYTHVGFLGLSLASAVLVVCTFYLLIKPFHLSFWQKGTLAILFLPGMLNVYSEGLRGQTLGTFIFAMVVYELWKTHLRGRGVLTTPLVFLLWANTHGSFIVGLIALSIYVLIDSVLYICTHTSKQGIATYLVQPTGTVVASIACTLMNPFSYNLYGSVLRVPANIYLKYITEWVAPNITFACIGCDLFVLYALLFIFLSILQLKQKPRALHIFSVIMGGILMLLALQSRRNLELFIIVTLPFVAYYVGRIRVSNKYTYALNGIYSIILGIVITSSVFTRLPGYDLSHYSLYSYCRYSTGCSVKVANYLKAHPPEGNGFNTYDWGGFFIGAGVPAKLFVDSRMALWETNGERPFADYIKIYEQNDLKLFRTYGFRWAVIESSSTLSTELLGPSQALGVWKNAYTDGNTQYLIRID